MKHRLKMQVCLLAWLVTLLATAQQNATGLFRKAQLLFQQGEYTQVASLLEHDLSDQVYELNKQEIDYMRVCIAYELQQPYAIEQIKDYQKKYPIHPYQNRLKALLGSAYYYEGNFSAAIQQLKATNIDELAPKDREDCIYRLAVSLMQMERLNEAKAWFETLCQLSSTYKADATYQLAYMDYQEKQFDTALTYFLSLRENEQYASVVPYYIADIYYQQEAYEEASTIITNYFSTYPEASNRYEMQRILGGIAFHEKNYAKAIQQLTIYVNDAPLAMREARYQLGLSYYFMGSYAKATSQFNIVCLKRDAIAQSAYLHQGFLYLKKQQYDKAREAFEQASLMNFDTQLKEQALFNYAVCLHETNYSAFGSSVNTFETFLNDYPTSTYASTISDYLVDIYLSSKAYQNSLASIEKIKQPNTQIVKAKQYILYQLGVQMMVNEQYDKALPYFDQCIRLGNYDKRLKINSYYWKGEANERLERYRTAKRYFKRYLSSTSQTSSEMYGLAHYALGYMALQNNEIATAIQWFEKAVKTSGLKKTTVLADAYNRLGDCYAVNDQLTEAQNHYASAQELDKSMSDYSLYKEALIVGKQGDYIGELHFLKKLIEQYPNSDYLAAAYYERAKAYQQLNDSKRAIVSYQDLLKKYPATNYASQAAYAIGQLHEQQSETKKAIKAYKLTTQNYEGSESSRLALQRLKVIYTDLNQIDHYAKYTASLGSGQALEGNERDSLTYIAAFKVYQRTGLTAAAPSFERYLKQYPQGKYNLKAHYYTACYAYKSKDIAKAIRHFKAVVAYPHSEFAEKSMAHLAGIYYAKLDFKLAYKAYQQLLKQTSTRDNRIQAKTGMMRCAYLMRQYKSTITAAHRLLRESSLTKEQRNEAYYAKAKSSLALRQNKEALTSLEKLATDTRTRYGAEAKYLLVDYYLQQADYLKAEKEALSFIRKNTPHEYWLARTFIALSDIYAKMDRKLEAQQKLLSLQKNYKGKDDIARMIKERLNRLMND
jgi:tetratricopeptide (TPR) repeat protein